MPKIQNLTMNSITSEKESSLQNIPDDIREECIMKIKNKRNNQYHTIIKETSLETITITKTPVTMGKPIKIRARKRTNHHHTRMQSHVGSEKRS
jgi:hypothetical protein